MNRIATIALVFAGLALAQSAQSWRYYPENAVQGKEVRSGLQFYTTGMTSPVVVSVVLVPAKDGVSWPEYLHQSLTIDRSGGAFLAIDQDTMRKVLTGAYTVARIEVNGKPVDYPKAGREYR